MPNAGGEAFRRWGHSNLGLPSEANKRYMARALNKKRNAKQAKHKDQDLLVLGWKRFYLNSARGFLVW